GDGGADGGGEDPAGGVDGGLVDAAAGLGVEACGGGDTLGPGGEHVYGLPQERVDGEVDRHRRFGFADGDPGAVVGGFVAGFVVEARRSVGEPVEGALQVGGAGVADAAGCPGAAADGPAVFGFDAGVGAAVGAGAFALRVVEFGVGWGGVHPVVAAHVVPREL